jgi:hypothetical protein
LFVWLISHQQQYFSLRINQPLAINQQYSSLRTNQHHLSATSQTNMLEAQKEQNRLPVSRHRTKKNHPSVTSLTELSVWGK